MKREIKAYIEAELRDYHRTKQELDEFRQDIIEATPVAPERGSNLPGNQTAAKGLRLLTNRRIKYMEMVLGAIEDTLAELDETDIELVKLKYWQRPRQLTDAGIAMKLAMAKVTVYRRSNKICASIGKELGLLDEVKEKMQQK